mgnify:CR=1 FL=1
MAIGTVGRFAMQPAIKSLMNFLVPKKMTALEMAGRFGPDALIGGLVGLQTPGDPVDKLIAGLGTAVPAAAGGLVTGGAARSLLKNSKMDQQKLETLVGLSDLAGSIGTDFLAYPATNQLLRTKSALTGGAFETPFEQLNREQQIEFAEGLQQQLLAQYGLLPGTRSDDYLSQLGLAG